MLRTKNQFVIIIRKYSDHQHAATAIFSKEALCSPENRERCINRMKLAAKHATMKIPSTKFAAVLIPLVQTNENSDDLSILYTVRSNKLRKHVRQVSFPGGIRDSDDASFIDCALRETNEEIGISSDKVSVWGEAELIYPRNAPAIMPVVGSIENYRADELRLNPDEVESVFTVSIAHLCQSKRHTQFRMSPGRGIDGYSVPLYLNDDKRIWGITALITNLFLHALLPNDVYQSKINYISKYKL